MKDLLILTLRYLLVASLGSLLFASGISVATGIVVAGTSNLGLGILFITIGLFLFVMLWHYITILLDLDKDPI